MTELAPYQGQASRTAVAQYLRMSTEKQIYSPANQAAAIAQYAHANGIKVGRTYSDEGRSGVRLEGRRALQKLLRTFRQAPLGLISGFGDSAIRLRPPMPPPIPVEPHDRPG